MDDARVDSREVMSGEEMERIYKDVPALAELARLQLRAILDAALSRYAAKMGTGGRRVEGYAYPYTQGHWGFTSKPDGDGYGDIQPATLYIHEPPKPVVEMTLMAAVEEFIAAEDRNNPGAPWVKSFQPVQEALARERAKVGK